MKTTEWTELSKTINVFDYERNYFVQKDRETGLWEPVISGNRLKGESAMWKAQSIVESNWREKYELVVRRKTKES